MTDEPVMRFPGRPVALAAIAVSLAGVTCAFPTDKSDAVFVTLELPSRVVFSGQEMSVHARAWRVVGTDTAAIENVDFVFYSTASTIARVDKDCCGYATVTGVNRGSVDIVARAVAFEGARQADSVLRVSGPVEVDSVRPKLVRYGDTITVFGVGVDSIVLAQLGGADLFQYFFSGKHDSVSGLGTITYWVPPPAHTDTLLYVGKGVFKWAKDTTRILPFDIYEPNDVAPTAINLEAPPAFPQLPFFRYLNPALAFEQLKRDQTFGVDWYRFNQTTTRDLTLILTAPTARGTFLTFLSDSLFFNPADTSIHLGPDAWTIGPGEHDCHGHVFKPPEAAAESTIVALRGMPAGAIHALSFYSQPARYGLTVIQGYVATRPALFPPDPREEDDYCNAADARGSVATVPAATFRDTLTIDNPHDVDWIRFTVGGPLAQPVRFRTGSLTAAIADSSDIDLFVLTAPPGADTLVEVGRLAKVGSNEDGTFLLAPRAYYAVVVDYQGVPTRYSICIGTCPDPFPTPPAPQLSAATESSRSTPMRRKPPLRAPTHLRARRP